MRRAHIITCLIVLFACSVTWGSGFAVNLELSEGKKHLSTESRQKSQPALGSHRESMNGSASSQFTLHWKVLRTAHDTSTDVLIHCYVVRLDRSGQASPALEPKRVVLESALTMDFPAGDSATATLPFRVDGPGVFLVRVEAGAGAPGDYAEVELMAK